MAMEIERQLEVAQRLRELRGPKPQEQIAEEVGVTLRAYSAWESGGGIAYRNLQKLAEIHGVTTNWLLYGDEKPEGARSQLDRIEAGVNEILSRLRELPEEIEQELDDALQQADETSASNVPSERTARPRRKAR